MTDNEIIKALECWLKWDCNGCPFGSDNGDCDGKCVSGTLSLINRQKAELDDLKRDDLPRCKDALRRANEIGMALEKENQELRAEIERLQADLTRVCAERDARICTNNFIRAEAIKEFAERLKEKLVEENYDDCQFFKVVGESDIDNLVKEMVGEDK